MFGRPGDCKQLFRVLETAGTGGKSSQKPVGRPRILLLPMIVIPVLLLAFSKDREHDHAQEPE